MLLDKKGLEVFGHKRENSYMREKSGGKSLAGNKRREKNGGNGKFF